jgi:hypothetical protein
MQTIGHGIGIPTARTKPARLQCKGLILNVQINSTPQMFFCSARCLEVGCLLEVTGGQENISTYQMTGKHIESKVSVTIRENNWTYGLTAAASDSKLNFIVRRCRLAMNSSAD